MPEKYPNISQVAIFRTIVIERGLILSLLVSSPRFGERSRRQLWKEIFFWEKFEKLECSRFHCNFKWFQKLNEEWFYAALLHSEVTIFSWLSNLGGKQSLASPGFLLPLTCFSPTATCRFAPTLLFWGFLKSEERTKMSPLPKSNMESLSLVRGSCVSSYGKDQLSLRHWQKPL